MLDILAQPPFFFRWEVALVQLLGFVVFFLLMKALLFDRLLGFMRKRDDELREAARRIAGSRAEAERTAAELAAKLAAADKEAYAAMQGLLHEGLAAKAAILQTAQDEGERIVQEARRAVASEKAEALRTMDAQVKALSELLAENAASGR